MANYLSSEDLSFFDSHNGAAKKSETSNIYNDFLSLSLNSPNKSRNSLAHDVQDAPGEDDFGDFVQFEEHNEHTDRSAKSVPSVSNVSSLDIFQLNGKSPVVKPSVPSFESSAKTLGTSPTDLKFGQTSHSRSLSANEQWSNILGARPGPSTTKRVPSLTPDIVLDRRPTKSHHKLLRESLQHSITPSPPSTNSFNLVDIKLSTAPASPAVSSHAPATAFHKEPGDDDNFADFADFAADDNIPTPDVLLVMMHEKVLPIANKLFDSLAPLSYPLKKRVLSQQNTKIFFAGYVETVHVAARIMAGRNRRVLTADQKSQADREARHLERVWQSLSPRLQAILPPDQTVPVLNPKIAFPDIHSRAICSVCGLSKVEIIRGQPRPAWTTQYPFEGHKTCISWWTNRSVFGLE